MSTKSLCSTLLLTAITSVALAQNPPTPTDPDQTPRNERPDGATVPPTNTSRNAMNTTASKYKSVTPQSFTTQAAVISKAEVELGQLALKNSKDSSVQKFAQRMITDHTNANQQLKSVAAKENLDIPQQLDPEHQALKDKLSNLKGTDFDREYSKAMAEGHDKAVALFQAASQNTQMPSALKQFASSTLPTLKTHQEMAHSMSGGSDMPHSNDRDPRS